ncbi:MAG TPA: hypothetical protein VJZ71_01555 [Phycisphaerae bacterium]|nr:hypothetical protein [Phycisphaerae bacterium]
MNPRCHTCVLSALILCSGSPAAFGQVSARIDRAGLFAGADPIVRSGNWSFVEVSLRFRGAAPFDGQLRLNQLDRDGDVVTSVLPVALAPNEEWRPYQIYFVPHEAVGGNLRVSLHDAQGAIVDLVTDAGETVTELTAPPVSEARQDDLLIIDLTNPRRLPHVAALDMDAAGERDRINARQVRGLSPRELPSMWQGLEPVDAIVWDDADPSELSQQQIEALVGWVKAGGRLLITAGKNWQALAQSPLAAALPVTLRGVSQTKEAQEFLDLVENNDYESRLALWYSKHPITRCKMNPLPDALPMPADCPNTQICYRRLLGRGVVVFVGASLRQLLPPPKKAAAPEGQGDASSSPRKEDDPFVDIACEKIVARRLLALPAVREEAMNPMLLAAPDLFQYLRTSIAFESVGTRFLILAILFAIAYTFLATTGSYWYLKRRSWEHHCWSAFGAASLAASIVGTGMVGLLRGVQKKLWQTTIVDAQAGVDYGYASCLFGIKTPNHTRLDLRLPVGDPEMAAEQAGPLRPMPAGTAYDMTMADSKFTAAAAYESERAGAALRRVPVRATLKELQGSWHGPLGGVLEAKLVLKKTTEKEAFRYEFGDGSFIRNNLGVDLHDCYLLETSEEVAGERPTPLTRCFKLGDIPKDGPGSQLDEQELRRRLYYETDSRAPADAPLVRIKQLPMLDREIENFARELRPLAMSDFQTSQLKLTGDQEYPAMFLLSLYDLMPKEEKNRPSFRRSHGRSLSCTHRLGKETAILIGHANEPPAATLEVGGRPLKPNKSHTIYRFVIPVRSEQ